MIRSVFFLMILVSCSKSDTKTKCYECTVGNGTTWEVKEVCSNQIDTMTFEDNMGNQLQSVCTEK